MVVVVGVVVVVVVVKSSERFKALPIELESWAFSMLFMGEKLLQISFFLKSVNWFGRYGTFAVLLQEVPKNHEISYFSTNWVHIQDLGPG